jgi:hypothetical protein
MGTGFRPVPSLRDEWIEPLGNRGTRQAKNANWGLAVVHVDGLLHLLN